MSNPLSQTTIIGRLMKDPTFKEVPGRNNSTFLTGNLIVSVRRSSQDIYKDKNGEEQNSDVFFCDVAGSTATFIQKHFHKGDYIVLQGTILTYKRNGEEYANGWKLKIDSVAFAPSKREDNQTNNHSTNYNNNNSYNNGYNNKQADFKTSFESPASNNAFDPSAFGDFGAITIDDDMPF